MMLFTEGTSWPNGLSQGRFNWLELPSTEGEVVNHLLHALRVDQGERETVLAWGEHAAALADCIPGVTAYLAKARCEFNSLRRLANFASRVSKNHRDTVIFSVQHHNVRAVARSILKVTGAREPSLDRLSDKVRRVARG